jgi:dolichol-phosphate mannosyltransferase
MLMGSFLATIVWRFGPGGGVWQPLASRTIFNGQCIVARREDLLAFGGWARVRGSLVEDVALARAWRRDGRALDFADASSVLEVRMYGSLRESWDGWGRSLMAVDETPRLFTALDLLTIWVALGSALVRRDRWFLAVRLLMLGPMATAFRPRGWGYWLSPLADLPVAVRLTWSVLRPGRSWRGRTYGPRTARR